MKDMDHPEYTKLAAVFHAAYDQAARGKGKDRHASSGQPFEDQPMSAINRQLGSIDGFLYQAAKKAQEARRLPYGRAQAELLGAINYLAGAVIALDTWAQGTLPIDDKPTIGSVHAPWLEWFGGDRPYSVTTPVQVKTREGVTMTGLVGDFRWVHSGIGLDIVEYRLGLG